MGNKGAGLAFCIYCGSRHNHLEEKIHCRLSWVNDGKPWLFKKNKDGSINKQRPSNWEDK